MAKNIVPNLQTFSTSKPDVSSRGSTEPKRSTYVSNRYQFPPAPSGQTV